MQKQKKEIRDKILDVAMKRFYAAGYKNTLTRQIASDVGMSVSNLYKYFRNKEDVFETLVSGYYSHYLGTFNKFISHENDDHFDTDAAQTLAQAIFESIKGHQIEFVVLVAKSKGTKYASFRQEITSGLEKHIKRGIQESRRDEYMIRIFVENLFNGIIEIAKDYRSDEWAFNNLLLLAQYHIKGISILYE